MVLNGLDLKDKIRKMISNIIENTVDACLQGTDKSQWKFDELRNYFFGYLCTVNDFIYSESDLLKVDPEEIKDMLNDRVDSIISKREAELGEEIIREHERRILLYNVDTHWMDHLEAMDDLKGSVGLHAYAQRDPLKEYQIQGADMFDEMNASICEQTARMVLSSVPKKQEVKRETVAKITNAGFEGGTASTEPKKPVVKGKKVGRNDPCPCGSGKKYKKCCGQNENAN